MTSRQEAQWVLRTQLGDRQAIESLLGTLSSPDLFRPWMFRIASRNFFRYLKQRKRWPDHMRDDDALVEIVAIGWVGGSALRPPYPRRRGLR